MINNSKKKNKPLTSVRAVGPWGVCIATIVWWLCGPWGRRSCAAFSFSLRNACRVKHHHGVVAMTTTRWCVCVGCASRSVATTFPTRACSDKASASNAFLLCRCQQFLFSHQHSANPIFFLRTTAFFLFTQKKKEELVAALFGVVIQYFSAGHTR